MRTTIAKIIKSSDPDCCATAVEALRQGELVAIPTETVYGLAADATHGQAVARIFAAKGRPGFNPLICHVSNVEMAERFGRFSAAAKLLAKHFWPGPLTLVVPKTPDCPAHDLVTAGLETIAIRAPKGIGGEIIAELGQPLAAPSANRSGHVSATTAQHVAADIGESIKLIIDGGPSPVGLESTIVKVDGDQLVLLRPGNIPISKLEKVSGLPVSLPKPHGKIEAPGMLTSHYAPNAPVILNATDITSDEALLAFGKNPLPGNPRAVLNLSPEGDLLEAAANLYDYLRRLDQPDIAAIKVQTIPTSGPGWAINDRLNRAAAPRKKTS